MTIDNSRRADLVGFGALAASRAALSGGPSRADTAERIIPTSAGRLSELMDRWRRAPRNSISAQVFSFGYKDFFAVFAMHSTAHFALLDQTMWDKYGLADLAGAKSTTNRLAMSKSTPTAFALSDDSRGVFGSNGDTIPALQEHGVAFTACHNAIWEAAAKLIASGKNPYNASHEARATEFTNRLIDGVVLTPGVVVAMVELQRVGFHYAA